MSSGRFVCFLGAVWRRRIQASTWWMATSAALTSRNHLTSKSGSVRVCTRTS
ncbi:hypothetical protein PR003_g14269 [Phytophthora rubi]|uniref:Uncharacterized protein n=1 Tax=Phytophthora rubi TaxID=129364 RepID=A0A6A4F5V5_9STRA|nr:hypothetical protein PR002_g14937 [Phytophthora rubi]KAE9018160.1 hypothetical protein PR001_g14205 [Phytophthora rubi]KAE9332942.1 hypothetical protein PR003_g14269 [Phytophthora rubi]